MEMDRKSVLITGCSVGGIGDALAQELHRKGLQVFATARDLTKISHLREMGCKTIRVDVTDPESVKACLGSISEKTGGKLDILINNAGQVYNSTILDTNIETARTLFETNIFGVLSITQRFAPLLMKAKGTIVNIGSIGSICYGPYPGAYGFSKAALQTMTHAMRIELAPFGLHVVLVTTGVISTNLQDNRLSKAEVPETSLYYPIADKIEAMVSCSDTKPMPAAEFARRVVPKILKANPTPVIYEGPLSTITWILACLAWLIGPKVWDWVTGKPSGLWELGKMVKEKEERERKAPQH